MLLPVLCQSLPITGLRPPTACHSLTLSHQANAYIDIVIAAGAAVLRVLATSRTPYYEQAQDMGVEFYEDVDDFCEEHPDVVILASSILSTEAVLRSLPVQRLKRSTLFVDVLSVKVITNQVHGLQKHTFILLWIVHCAQALLFR
jgi:hypothetical protein